MKKQDETRCPACKRKYRRSTAANARYWLLLHKISANLKPSGNVYSPDQWHIYMKTRYLGAEDVMLPNGKTLIMPNSTATLDTGEFHAYVEKVEHWAGEHDVWLDSLEDAA